MRDKDIKALLKSTMESQIPDVLSRIDLQSIDILDAPKPRFNAIFKERFASIALTLIATTMLIVGLISLGRTPNNPIEIPMTLTAEKTYSFSAISSSTLLNAIDLELNQTQNMILLSSMMNQETHMKQRVALLNPYFNMIELFISSDESLTFSDPIASTLSGYTYQVSYEIVSLNNETATYVFHYNETQSGDETLTEGVLVLEQQSFYLEGTKVVNGEKTIITTKTYNNPLLKDLQYVEFISTEVANTQWFDYGVYINGDQIESAEVRLETIGENLRIRLTYEHELDDIEVDIKAMRVLDNGIAKIRAEYEYQGDGFEEKGSILVSVEVDPILNTNEYRYEITNSKGEKDDFMGNRGHHDYGKDKDHSDDEDSDDDHPGRDNKNR
ncbi:hypothetical protein [Paracholeplasma manati]|uniref:Uncharacterized protein n=1 Tax=Paracholeplasma manati TaxID=591373 RepID=A0ABT2Y5U0_9MOLU|nr:hypothetical protein [Paracholeplasma manati]MCV2232106.1 hypothetical protein [Paracholeplasma manati]MDG0887776.1 hypothetical protein [Paracholeplasma manati]